MYGNYVDQSGAYSRNASQVDPNANQGLDDILNVWMRDYKTGARTSKTAQTYGSGIPYLFNIMGDLLINPSTVSPSTFKKMVETDNIIQQCMRFNVDSIINTLGPYVHPNKDIQRTIRRSQEKLVRGWRVMLRDILTGLYAGYSNQELIWSEYDEELGGDTIASTMALPQNTIVNRVTPQGELQVEGIGQYIFNSFFPGFSALFSYGIGNVFAPLVGGEFGQGADGGRGTTQGTDPYAQTGDLDYPYRTYMISPIGLVWIPIAKVLRYEYYGVTNNINPYGKSMLRAAYQLWVTKQAVWQFMLRAIKNKSAPLGVLYARPDVPTSHHYDPNDPNAAQKTHVHTTLAAGERALQELDSTNYMILSGMEKEIYEFKSYANEANIEIMEKVIRYIDEMIASVLMVPRTTFGGGGEEGGGFALAKAQEDFHYRFIMSSRQDLVDTLLNQFVRPIIEEIYVEEEIEGTLGNFEIATTSIEDQLKLTETYKNAIEKGYLFPSRPQDINHMRESINFDKLPEAEIEKLIAEVAKQMQAENGSKSRTGEDNARVGPYSHTSSKDTRG